MSDAAATLVPDDVHRVADLVPYPVGHRRAGLYGPYRAARRSAAFVQCDNERTVDVTAQDEVGAGIRPRGDGQLAAAKQMFLIFSARDMDWLMGHDYTQLFRPSLFEAPRHPLYLSGGHFALDVPIAPSGANANDQEVATVMDRFKIAAKDASVSKIRPQQPSRQIEQRDVVIAGDDKA